MGVLVIGAGVGLGVAVTMVGCSLLLRLLPKQKEGSTPRSRP